MTELLAAAEALARIRAAAAPLPPERCALAAAEGRVLAAAVHSPAALPPFANSAMDGYALAGGADPVPAGTVLPVEGEQVAGDGPVRGAAGAWAIMTGARLPDGLDRVIPVERIERLEAPPRVRLLAPVPAGQHVRASGSDVAAGAAVLAAGTQLEPRHLMLLAALGVAAVPVATRPRAAVICTGRELVDDPAAALGPGQIRNANGPWLAARLRRAGAAVVLRETVGDDPADFLAAAARARAAGAELIVSTGAVSMGTHDFVPDALRELGAETLFHKLAIRPGKPQLCARLADGTLFFGLPGNPISAAVGMRFFVSAALRRMLGLAPEQPWRLPLAAACSVKPGWRLHLKARVALDAGGRLAATVLPGQASYRIAPFARANAWVLAGPDLEAAPAGTRVAVCSVGHLEPLAPAAAEELAS